MILVASRTGEYPSGVYWTAGESRDLDLSADQVERIPAWLTLPPVKPAKKTKGKGKRR